MAQRLRTPCTEWAGCRRPDGRGWVNRKLPWETKGKPRLAHRYFWMLANGPIPDGHEVMHICDNPPCINLEHLRLGTHAENMADMKAKRRGASRHGAVGDKVICARGHRFTEATTYWDKRGHRACRRCRTDATYRYRRRQAGIV